MITKIVPIKFQSINKSIICIRSRFHIYLKLFSWLWLQNIRGSKCDTGKAVTSVWNKSTRVILFFGPYIDLEFCPPETTLELNNQSKKQKRSGVLKLLH